MTRIHDSWIGKQARVKQSPSPFYDSWIGKIGIIERYATTEDVILTNLPYLNEISLPPCIFALKVEGYEKPIFVPIELLELVEEEKFYTVTEKISLGTLETKEDIDIVYQEYTMSDDFNDFLGYIRRNYKLKEKAIYDFLGLVEPTDEGDEVSDGEN